MPGVSPGPIGKFTTFYTHSLFVAPDNLQIDKVLSEGSVLIHQHSRPTMPADPAMLSHTRITGCMHCVSDFTQPIWRTLIVPKAFAQVIEHSVRVLLMKVFHQLCLRALVFYGCREQKAGVQVLKCHNRRNVHPR